jgi:hypothetical protein
VGANTLFCKGFYRVLFHQLMLRGGGIKIPFDSHRLEVLDSWAVPVKWRAVPQLACETNCNISECSTQPLFTSNGDWKVYIIVKWLASILWYIPGISFKDTSSLFYDHVIYSQKKSPIYYYLL